MTRPLLSSAHFANTAVVAGGLALFGVWVIRTMPEDVGAAYLPLLFGQFFGASSGFRQVADAGYFDGLLVSGATRGAIGATHLALSSAPGLAAWFVVYGAEVHMLGLEGATGLRMQYVVAVLLVSSVAWAVALPTGRFVGGLLWVGAEGLVVVNPDGVAWLAGAVSQPPAGTVEVMTAAAAMILCPVLFLVPSLTHVSGNPWVLGLAMGVTCGAAGAGMSWISRRDYRGRT